MHFLVTGVQACDCIVSATNPTDVSSRKHSWLVPTYAPAATPFELEEEIARRKQGATETAREYVTALQTLMRRH
ncbi:hypothetical protein X777_03204 [Ooceraea biroi]|uniref:Uncharacterized protein n=1 Tax=Ooceraea biroi TaxID=2015173 RepID=A0A026WNV8_OOCBI|nr:hypothetical protein X777_03204 [Ooceraea biroi]